ncbi:MAG: hypothetical protein U0136_05990 [Bdellovibrionota bacterium]
MNRSLSVISLTVISIVGTSNGALAEAPKNAPAEKAASPSPTKSPELEPGSNVLCEVDVFYTWKPAPRKDDQEAEPPAPVKDFYITAGEEGLVEEEVTNRLTAKIPQFSQQALQLCASVHQDQTLCVTSKLKANNAHYEKLDFVARRALVEAINLDCQEQAGECIGAEVSDVKCRVNRPPDLQPQPSPGAADAAPADKAKDGKDAKKK